MNVLTQIAKSIQLPPLKVVKVVAVRPDGKILILRRSRVLSVTQKNDLPGGIVDKGEDILTAVSRETAEEVGLKTTKVKPLQRSFFMSSVGPINLHGYVAEVDGDVALSWEHDKYWWVDPREAIKKHKLSKPYRNLIEKYVGV